MFYALHKLYKNAGCSTVRVKGGIPMFVFPKFSNQCERFKKWVSATPPDKAVCRLICRKHFLDSDMRGTLLSKEAIPTLCLPETVTILDAWLCERKLLRTENIQQKLPELGSWKSELFIDVPKLLMNSRKSESVEGIIKLTREALSRNNITLPTIADNLSTKNDCENHTSSNKNCVRTLPCGCINLKSSSNNTTPRETGASLVQTIGDDNLSHSKIALHSTFDACEEPTLSNENSDEIMSCDYINLKSSSNNTTRIETVASVTQTTRDSSLNNTKTPLRSTDKASIRKLRLQLLYRNKKIDALKKQVRSTQFYMKGINSLPLPQRQFIACQIENVSRSKSSRRFSSEVKALSLMLYKSSPKAYKLLSEIFMPQRRTLKSIVH